MHKDRSARYARFSSLPVPHDPTLRNPQRRDRLETLGERDRARRAPVLEGHQADRIAHRQGIRRDRDLRRLAEGAGMMRRLLSTDDWLARRPGLCLVLVAVLICTAGAF